MPKDGWMRFQGLRLRLDTRNGACVLFDSAKLRHSTEECELSKAGEAARMGVALHCRKNVSDVPIYQRICVPCILIQREVTNVVCYACQAGQWC